MTGKRENVVSDMQSMFNPQPTLTSSVRAIDNLFHDLHIVKEACEEGRALVNYLRVEISIIDYEGNKIPIKTLLEEAEE